MVSTCFLLLIQGGYCTVEAKKYQITIDGWTLNYYDTAREGPYGPSYDNYIISYTPTDTTTDTLVFPEYLTTKGKHSTYYYHLDRIGDNFDYLPTISFGSNIKTIKFPYDMSIESVINAPNLQYVEGDGNLELYASFKNCSSLKKVKAKSIRCIGWYKNRATVSAYSGSFENCYNLEEIETVSSDIAVKTFLNCKKLTSVKTELGTNVFSSLDSNSLQRCTSMPYVILKENNGRYPDIGSNVFSDWTKKQKIFVLGDLKIDTATSRSDNENFFPPNVTVYGYGNAKVYNGYGSEISDLKSFVEKYNGIFVDLGSTISLDIAEKYLIIGDNTEAQLNITGSSSPGNRLEIYDTKTEAILYEEEILGTGTQTINKAVSINLDDISSRPCNISGRIVAGEDFIIGDTTIYYKNDIISSSNSFIIDKKDHLALMNEISRMENNLPKFIILDDKNRYYDNNTENLALTNEVNATINGIYIIGENTDSEILKRFLVAE